MRDLMPETLLCEEESAKDVLALPQARRAPLTNILQWVYSILHGLWECCLLGTLRWCPSSWLIWQQPLSVHEILKGWHGTV